MYQPVSTKTIKADGDLNINPYDLLATDVKCDTVEATEFVCGVGNFESVQSPKLYFTGNISTEGDYYVASIPSKSAYMSGYNFSHGNDINYGVVPYPTNSSLIDITKAVYSSEISIAFQLHGDNDNAKGVLYRDGVEYGDLVIPLGGYVSNTINVSTTMYDTSVWTVKYVYGYGHEAYNYRLVTPEIKLYLA